MTSLYKRYIPPKAPVAPVISIPDPPEPPKRKRERSEEEVAERKAKKAKKKGVPVSSIEQKTVVKPAVVKEKVVEKVPEAQPGPIVEEEVLEAGTVPLPDVDAVEEEAATGDFSHVRNKKKRHRLEKEARKAREKERKAAGKGGDGDGDAAGGVEGSGVDSEGKVDVDDDDDGEEVVASEDVEVETKSKKREEELKEAILDQPAEPTEVEVEVKPKKRKEKKAEVALDQMNEDRKALLDESAPAYDATQSQPKERRHKLEAVLSADPAEEEEDDDDAHLRKHGAILSNFQKASKRAQSQPKTVEAPEVESEPAQPTVQDLEMPDADLPPQPDDDEEAEDTTSNSNLPSWLANPTIISATSKATFADLGLDSKTLAHLSALKFKDALPVQQALLPLLLPPGTAGSTFLPGTEPILPDLAVSAATGSGKTLAYLLPILESLKHHPHHGNLLALIIVPTRELVLQVAAVAESLAKGSGVKVGMCTGSGKFSDEQSRLVRKSYLYTPSAITTDEEEEEGIDLACPPRHTAVHSSAIDLLIATPGRLLEHLDKTKGFNLVHLTHLILDEADKLLDHQSSLEISSLLQHISRPRTVLEQDPRERYLRARGIWDERLERRVRKVALSATMTRDVQRLGGLGLRFPRLVTVQQVMEENGKGGWEVPGGLREFVVPVGDGGEKPLVALEWLRERVFGDDVEEDSDSDSSSDSDSDSDSDTASSSASANDDEDDETITIEKSPKKQPATVLIFTSTTESATRLAHLLRALKTSWSASLQILTKTQNLPRSSLSLPLVVISTDRAARGLDNLSGRPISHVLQYDVPRSLTSYVHRVGRTARNGRDGEAWTLYSRVEAGWFLKAVGVEGGGEGEGVRRGREVERCKIFMRDEGVRAEYGSVLEGMRGEVLERG